MNWPVRLLTAADVDAVEDLIPLSVRGLQAGCYSSEQIEAALGPVFAVDGQLLADGTYFGVEDRGCLVGCGGWSRRQAQFGGDRGRTGPDPLLEPGRDAARIRAFFVHPDYARRGIGRALLEKCECEIAAAGFDRIELVATLAGEPLYARFGYAAVERFAVSLPGGLALPVVRMAKAMPAAADPALAGIRHYLRISPRVATAGQPEREEFAAIAAGGFDCVINLALPTSTHALADEAEVVRSLALEYEPIPVVWESPRFEDFERFVAVMKTHAEHKVFVHCAMNMRVSAFMYLYQTLVEGVPAEAAAASLHRVWTPDGVWVDFIREVSVRWKAGCSA